MKTQAEIDVRHRRRGWLTDSGWKDGLRDFPRPGARLRFREPGFHFHTDAVENAKRLLTAGHTYTLRTIELFSSCAIVTLEETGEAEFECSQFENLSVFRDQA